MKINISILGSTGSIGLTVLKIIDKRKKDFKIDILSANKNYKLIIKQIKKYKPKFFIISDLNTFIKVKKKLKYKTKILNSFNNLNLNKKKGTTVSAIPGIAGLNPTLQMIKKSKRLLIANKESIICGWSLLKKEAKAFNTKIIPVDSEHYSIFKLIENRSLSEIKKIYLTASGGPFLNYTFKKLKSIKPKDALKHPKWKMGKKISVDSATLMNKIFELVEAQKLFNISYSKLDILIHPESLIHAIIILKNGLKKFIYHDTSMIIPLANAIYDGNLDIKNFLKKENSNTNNIKDLTFKKINKKIFPAIKMKNKANLHPSTPIIINSANEVLVDQFLKKKIPFLDITKTILSVLNDRQYKKYAILKPNSIKIINLVDSWAKNLTNKKLGI